MAKVHHRRGGKPKAPKSKRQFLIWLGAGAVVALGTGYVYLGQQPGASAAGATTPDGVVLEKPIHAVHEMGAGPLIPFLPTSQPQPKITIPGAFYNFGRIGPKDTVTRDFLIRNDGGAPLTISRAYTTCGCTTADISARVIPPGKAASVKIVFDAGFHDTRGKTVDRGLIIENNDRRNPKAEIWIRANVSQR